MTASAYCVVHDTDLLTCAAAGRGCQPLTPRTEPVVRQCCACGVPVMLDRDTNRWVDERNQAVCPMREGNIRGHLPG